ncbi:hypothetical protein [Azospirillum halopraeferens]|uniref:hypothetical protein n=1 Tax=Azospirillum halopraeferens TaxID=34010 RepID=UPI0004081CEF|nr:hypothetical protein [Azospirillum halopraeferens]
MTASPFTDLLLPGPDGRLRLAPGVHPLDDLLERDADSVLAAFRDSQRADFRAAVGVLDDPSHPLSRRLAEIGPVDVDAARVHALFSDLHDHVMEHPVWRHPFFRRVFAGEMERAHLVRFAAQYHNQIKNTRQCVAMAIGRFHSLAPLPPVANPERLSEFAQIVLAQLVADEYGVGSHAVEDYPTLDRLLGSTTHIVMYGQLFDGLGVPGGERNPPLLHAVADNVLTQRLLAGDPAFTPLEALASVGLGMEWGVPEFFSLLLGGIIRWARATGEPLTAHHLHVFIAHVRYDVMHAIAVTLMTALFVRDRDDVARVKAATNTLMSARYAMMSGLYADVFGEPCPGPAAIGLEARYHLPDRRIETALRAARRTVAAGSVADSAAYRERTDVPFVFGG